MVTTTLLVNNLVVKVLFDLGAIHSFISMDLAFKMITPKKSLDQVLIINTLLGRALIATNGVDECEVKRDEQFTRINLVVLNIKDYEVILGMDQLLKYHACINCYHKIMTYQFKDGMAHTFQGGHIPTMTSFVSCAKVPRLLKN